MAILLFLAVVALGVIAWILFKIDAKLQAIGDMIHDHSRPEERRQLTDSARIGPERPETPIPTHRQGACRSGYPQLNHQTPSS